MFDNNELLGGIGNEGEPPFSPSITTIIYDRQYRLPDDHDIDMISPSDNDIYSSRTSSGANTGKQKMKASVMQTQGGGAPRCFHYATKFKNQRWWFNSKQKVSTSRTLNNRLNIFDYISLHSRQAWPTNNSSYDSTFIPTPDSSSRKESSEETAILSEISSNESFVNLTSH